MDRFRACVKKFCRLKRLVKKMKKRIVKPKVTQVEVNEDLTKLYKDFVRIACTTQMKIIGINVFVPKFQWNFMGVILWMDNISYLLVNGSNIWIFWGDIKSLCYCLVTYGFGFTASIRLYKTVFCCSLYNDMLETIYGFGMTFDRKTDIEEIQLYKKYGNWCKRTGIVSTAWFTLVIIFLIIYPGFIFLANGTTILPFGFVIPGISYTENPGYSINYMYQNIQSVLCMTGFMLVLHIFFLFVMNACFQIDLIIIKLQKLDCLITADGSYEEEIVKIVKLYQDFINYMGKIADLYSVQLFVDFACFTFQNVVTLFVLVKERWIIGYIFEVMLFVLLLIPSVFGAMIEAKNDRLINEIYAISWHLLQVKERKTLRFFLESAQNASMLSVGGFIPLNMVLFQKTYNRVYSYLMFLKDTSG